MNKEKDIIRINRFIEEHHVLTLATSKNNIPYCANCFYVWLEDESSFLFTSDSDTKHIEDSVGNKKVAASIVLETKQVGKIQGLQIQGELIKVQQKEYSKYRKKYLNKFPFAVLKKTDLWLLKPVFMKLTDNRLGFGKKLLWGDLL